MVFYSYSSIFFTRSKARVGAEVEPKCLGKMPQTITKHVASILKPFNNMSILDSIAFQDCEVFEAKVNSCSRFDERSQWKITLEIDRHGRKVFINHYQDWSLPRESFVSVEIYEHPTDVTRKPLIQVISV